MALRVSFHILFHCLPDHAFVISNIDGQIQPDFDYGLKEFEYYF